MFELTKAEFDNLISQKATSSWGGRRKLPRAFTEQGIYMLMTVLRGDLATKQSKDAGKRISTITKLSDVAEYQEMIAFLLNNKKLMLK